MMSSQNNSEAAGASGLTILLYGNQADPFENGALRAHPMPIMVIINIRRPSPLFGI